MRALLEIILSLLIRLPIRSCQRPSRALGEASGSFRVYPGISFPRPDRFGLPEFLAGFGWGVTLRHLFHYTAGDFLFFRS